MGFFFFYYMDAFFFFTSHFHDFEGDELESREH